MMNARSTRQASFATTLMVTVGLIGCTAPNGIFYHEGTELAIDAAINSNPTEPFNLTVGYKRLVVSVVPGKCLSHCPEEENGSEMAWYESSWDWFKSLFSWRPERPPREALSLVSSFKLGPAESTSWMRQDLVIENNFATGRAAVALSRPAPAAGQGLVDGGPAGPEGSADDRIRMLLEGVGGN